MYSLSMCYIWIPSSSSCSLCTVCPSVCCVWIPSCSLVQSAYLLCLDPFMLTSTVCLSVKCYVWIPSCSLGTVCPSVMSGCIHACSLPTCLSTRVISSYFHYSLSSCLLTCLDPIILRWVCPPVCSPRYKFITAMVDWA